MTSFCSLNALLSQMLLGCLLLIFPHPCFLFPRPSLPFIFSHISALIPRSSPGLSSKPTAVNSLSLTPPLFPVSFPFFLPSSSPESSRLQSPCLPALSPECQLWVSNACKTLFIQMFCSCMTFTLFPTGPSVLHNLLDTGMCWAGSEQLVLWLAPSSQLYR